MKKLPIINHCEEVARSRLFRVEAVNLTFSNGVEADYERLKPSRDGGGGVLIIPMQSDNIVLMVHEYAVGTESYELGLPKGRIETGESAIEAANREMSEEIGFAAKRLTHLTSFTLAPGYMGHRTQVVLAEDLYLETAEGDEPEPLVVEAVSMDDLLGLGMRENCSEARTIAALYMARDHIRQRK